MTPVHREEPEGWDRHANEFLGRQQSGIPRYDSNVAVLVPKRAAMFLESCTVNELHCKMASCSDLGRRSSACERSLPVKERQVRKPLLTALYLRCTPVRSHLAISLVLFRHWRRCSFPAGHIGPWPALARCWQRSGQGHSKTCTDRPAGVGVPA
jgi:hypothetical protein